MRKLSSNDIPRTRYDAGCSGCLGPDVDHREWGKLMTRSGLAHTSPGTVRVPMRFRSAGRSGTHARLALAVAALVVAGMLTGAAVRGTSGATPGAIQLGQVPAAAVPTRHAGLHLVGSRSVDFLSHPGNTAGDTTRSGTTSGITSGSTALDDTSTLPTRASSSTVLGSNSGAPGRPGGTTTGSRSDKPSTGTGPDGSLPLTPTLPGATLPELQSPPATLPHQGTVPPVGFPPVTSPPLMLPPATVPQATLPGVAVPRLPVPPTVTLPKLPLVPFLEVDGPGSG